MTTPQPPEILTEMKLIEPVRELINSSYMRGYPIVLGYVDGGRPNLSFRGSAVVISDDEIAIWARNPEGGILKAMPVNPNVTMIYREGDPPPGRSRAILNIRGQGRVDSSEAMRKLVYDAMPQVERDADKDFKGVPVIIKLESVGGFLPGYRLQMRRE